MNKKQQGHPTDVPCCFCFCKAFLIGEVTPLSLRDVALFAKPPLKGEVGSEAARRGTPLSLRDVALFAKPPLKGEVGSEAARRGDPSVTA